MENSNELQQAEAHLKRAQADLESSGAAEHKAEQELGAAEAAEHQALHEIDEAVRQIKEAEAKPQPHVIDFWVDGEECETAQREWTADQIIREFGKKDPATNYLTAIHGNHKDSYQGKGDEVIKLHNGLSFQIVFTGPMPVSDGTPRTGPSAFAEGLQALGYKPQAVPQRPDHLVFDYEVPLGRFAGRTVRLGFVVPQDFPNITPTGPHVSPHVLPIHPSNDVPHPAGGVHATMSAAFRGAGGEWQYWSRPCPDWASRKKTVAAYMAHIWRLWETQ